MQINLMLILRFYKFVDGITVSNQVSTIAFNTPTLMELCQKVSNFSKYYNSKYIVLINYTFSTNDYDFKDFTPSTFPNNVDIRPLHWGLTTIY
jgi:hypothetical protein